LGIVINFSDELLFYFVINFSNKLLFYVVSNFSDELFLAHLAMGLVVSDKKIFKISAMLDFKSAPKTHIW
jgi:hypothetical protein